MVLGIKKDYCGVLHSSAGYYQVLSGTWVHLGALVGTEGTGWFWGYSVVPEGALENYWVLGLLGHTGGYMGVLGSKMKFCGVLWRIVVYSWVLLGSTGYWGALVGTKGTGGIARYCWVLWDIETLLPISTLPPSTPQHPVVPSHTQQYPTVLLYYSLVPPVPPSTL